MVAASIMAIVMIYIMNSFATQRDTYALVDQVSETQQNTRAIAGLIERDLRSAGYMVAPAAGACGRDNNNAPDTLFVSDWNAIAPADQLSSSLHSQKLGSLVSDISSAGDGVSITVDNTVLDDTASYAATGDYQVDGGVILVDVNNPGRGCATGIVDTVTSTSVTVDMLDGLGTTGTDVPELRLVPAIVYEVIAPGAPTVPELQRNGLTFARNVEDLQLAWFYDDNDDGLVDPDEYRGAVVGTNYDSSAVDGRLLREVRFNLVVRTGDDDPRNPNSAGRGQARENRAIGTVPGDDGRHRRVHTSTIRVRNIRKST